MSSRPFAPGRDGRFAFISHSHADRDVAFEYLTPLAREGYQLWYDEGLRPVEEWEPQLRESIRDCALFVLLLSEVSANRDAVIQEVVIAQELDKPILAIHLEQAGLPDSLRFLQSIQGIVSYGRNHDEVVDKIREQLVGYRVGRSQVFSSPAPEVPIRRRSRAGMPGKKAEPARSVTDAFADRIPESEALANSVAHQRRVLTGDVLLDGVGTTNVLTFYGGGGVGKSGLSIKLQGWASGDGTEVEHWGTWTGGTVIPVRWDFHDSEGDIQFADLMRVLRQALAQASTTPEGVEMPLLAHRFLAFDLALAAYLEAVSARDRESLGLTGRAASGVWQSLKVIAAQHRMGIPEQLNAAVVQRIVDRILRDGASPLLDDFDLGEFLRRCDQIPQGAEAPELVADLVYLLTQEIFYLPERERPALVFFLDHYERVQRKAGHSHEPNLARIVAHLPYCLFVVTGRHKLDWADPRRTDLHDAGPAAWPGLTEHAATDPRQHLLGRLSDEDTGDLYRRYRETHGWRMSDGLIKQLIRRSEGLPLHIEAVSKLAIRLQREKPGREFTSSDLPRELPAVVLRLIDVLSPEERNAFRAACVLPFFDLRLAAAVGQVEEGHVERAVRYALVEDNHDSIYPYRVHDEIRSLVRQDRSSEDYWGPSAWTSAAERGLAEAKKMISEAREAEDETGEVQAIALAIRLAYEWNLRDAGLVKVVTRAPSIAMLSSALPLVPAKTRPVTESESLIRFVHAYALPMEESAAGLLEVAEIGAPIRAIAARFGAYRLRSLCRFPEALEVLQGVIESTPEEARYTRGQYGITLRMARRFRDMTLYLQHREVNQRVRDRQHLIAMRWHGHVVSDTPEQREERLARIASTRTKHESIVGYLGWDAMLGQVTLRQVDEILEQASIRRTRGDIRTCLRALGYLLLDDAAKLQELVERIRKGIANDSSMAPTASHLLALRALYTRDPADGLVAYESVRPGSRGASWIPVEVWLEELGYPLDPVETQWLIPYEQVRKNWMTIADGVIQRAKAAGGDA